MHVKHNYLKIKLFISLCITNIMISNNENIWDNYFNDTIYNIDIYYYFLYNIQKEKLYEFSKNKELRFLKYNSNNLYKLLLKSKESGFIIKQQSWDYYYLKYEYDISVKLKKIINFIDYICYFEYEDNFLNYINYSDSESDSSFTNDLYDNKAIIIMHNYHSYNISLIDKIYINNIYTQLILALYNAFYTYNIIFNKISNNLIFIIDNYKNKRYCYNINNTNIYLYNCKYKIIIADLSYFKIIDNNDFNIDDNIYNNTLNLNIFKNINLSKKNLLNIKKKYIY